MTNLLLILIIWTNMITYIDEIPVFQVVLVFAVKAVQICCICVGLQGEIETRVVVKYFGTLLCHREEIISRVIGVFGQKLHILSKL